MQFLVKKKKKRVQKCIEKYVIVFSKHCGSDALRMAMFWMFVIDRS